jgi:hypothetical protein
MVTTEKTSSDDREDDSSGNEAARLCQELEELDRADEILELREKAE